jgi:hypothetical protein
LSDEGFEDISAPHRRKAARAIFLADEEHDALLASSWKLKTCRRTNPIATITHSRNGHVHDPTRPSSVSPKKIAMQSMSGR